MHCLPRINVTFDTPLDVRKWNEYDTEVVFNKAVEIYNEDDGDKFREGLRDAINNFYLGGKEGAPELTREVVDALSLMMCLEGLHLASIGRQDENYPPVLACRREVPQSPLALALGKFCATSEWSAVMGLFPPIYEEAKGPELMELVPLDRRTKEPYVAGVYGAFEGTDVTYEAAFDRVHDALAVISNMITRKTPLNREGWFEHRHKIRHLLLAWSGYLLNRDLPGYEERHNLREMEDILRALPTLEQQQLFFTVWSEMEGHTCFFPKHVASILDMVCEAPYFSLLFPPKSQGWENSALYGIIELAKEKLLEKGHDIDENKMIEDAESAREREDETQMKVVRPSKAPKSRFFIEYCKKREFFLEALSQGRLLPLTEEERELRG